MTTPTQPTGPFDKPTVYRGPGAVGGGAIVLLFCVGGAVDLIVEAGTSDLPGAAALLLVASFAFAYGVYPAAFAGDESLVVRNPLRTITLPWGAVARLSARLSFIAHTAHRRFTVWAVPVSLRDRRKAERTRLRDLSRQRRENDRAQRRGLGGGFGGFGTSSGARSGGGSEIERLSYADQAMTEMNSRRDGWFQRAGLGATAHEAAESAELPVNDDQLKITWNVVSILPIIACVIFLVVAIVVH
jgi:hypothetical protein